MLKQSILQFAENSKDPIERPAAFLRKPASEPWMLTLSSISGTRHPTWDKHLDSLQTPCCMMEQNLTPVLCSKLRRIAYTHAGGCHAWHSCGWTLWRDAPVGRTGADSRKCMYSFFLQSYREHWRPDTLAESISAYLLHKSCNEHQQHRDFMAIWKRSCHRCTKDYIYLLDLWS